MQSCLQERSWAQARRMCLFHGCLCSEDIVTQGGSRAWSQPGQHCPSRCPPKGLGTLGPPKRMLRLVLPSEGPCESHAWSVPPTQDVFV